MEQQAHSELEALGRVRWLRPGDWPILIKGLSAVAAIVVLMLAVTTYINARTLQARLRERIGAELEALASAEMGRLVDILSEQLTALESIALIDAAKEQAKAANQRYSGDQAAVEAQLLILDGQWRAAVNDDPLVQSIVNPDTNKLAFQLLDYVEAFPDHVEIFVTDRYGGLLAATGRTSDYYQADEEWWQAAYNGGDGAFYIGQPGYDESAGYTALNISAPIISEETGGVIGVARTTFRVDVLYRALAKLQIGEAGHVTLIDSTGLIIADPHVERVGKRVPGLWFTADVLREATGWYEFVDEEGVPTLAGHASIANVESGRKGVAAAIRSLGWMLFVTQAQAEAYAPVTSAVRTGVFAAGGFALLAAGLAFALARTVVTPITDLASVAQRMATGDLRVRAQVRRRDETGRLAAAFNSMADEIAEMVTTLEQRVAERTRGLRAVAEVSRATTSVLDPDALLRQVVDLARERFGLYYVGLFLLDQERQFAVLRAGTGEAGRQMLARGHRLAVGGDSMIGQCVARGEPRIALDVGVEAVRFDNPLLPRTRSELALPLRSRGWVIGAMTVQSVDEAAFDPEYIAVLQTMADQVAVAIDNAQLFADAQAALEEMEAVQRRYLGQSWADYLQAVEVTRYETEVPGAAPLGDAVLPEVRRAIAQGCATVSSGNGAEGQRHSALVAPIAFRGQVLGVLGIHDDETRQWTEEDLALVEAVVERMGMAADSLRLLDQTQRREANERLIRAIGDRMRSAPDIDALIQTTVREAAAALGTSGAFLQLSSIPEPSGAEGRGRG